MPGSIRENDQFVRHFVQANDINLVLDIGPGQGTYSDLLTDIVSDLDAVEAWEPYVGTYDLRSKYGLLWVEDAREWLKKQTVRGEWDKFEKYDLIIFGDVLEHMSEEESIVAWKNASLIARWGLISVPIVHYPQGAEGGNPFEVHVQDHLTPEHIRATFGPFDSEALYPWTGTFIKEF